MRVLNIILIFGIFLFVGCQKSDQLKGVWIADADNQYVTIVDYVDGVKITKGGKVPYYLTIDGYGGYRLEAEDYIESGTYTVDGDHVNFKDDDGFVSERCIIKDDGLHCKRYAFLYTKSD